MALFLPDTDPAVKEQFRCGILPIWQRWGLAFEDRVLVTLACDVINHTLPWARLSRSIWRLPRRRAYRKPGCGRP